MNNIEEVINPFIIDQDSLSIRETISTFIKRRIVLNRLDENIYIGSISFSGNACKGYLVVLRIRDEIIWITNRIRRCEFESRITCWSSRGSIIDGIEINGCITSTMTSVIELVQSIPINISYVPHSVREQLRLLTWYLNS